MTSSTLHRQIDFFLTAVATPSSLQEDADQVLWRALQLAPAYLAKASEGSAVPADGHTHESPAQAFEVANGQQGIAARYDFPAGTDAALVECYVIAVRWARLQGRITAERYGIRLRQLQDALIAANPFLASVPKRGDDAATLFHFALGVTSGFNPEDIRFFMDGHTHPRAMESSTYAAKFAAACGAENVTGLGWVPAPKTLDKIIAQRRV